MRPDEQTERMDQKARDLLEAFLDGRAALEVRPLSAGESVADSVGGVAILKGFQVRLVKDA